MKIKPKQLLRQLITWSALLPMATTVLVAYLGTVLWSLRVSMSKVNCWLIRQPASFRYSSVTFRSDLKPHKDVNKTHDYSA